MDINCETCGHKFNRDKYIGGVMVEEYVNYYGTMCPNCGHRIEPIMKPKFIKENEAKLELLKEQVRNILKEKLRQEASHT